MRAIDLRNHMQQIGTCVNWENTADHFIAGDPETEVKKVAVAWQSRTAALREAVEMGCQLFVTHEQTFYHEAQVKRKDEDQPCLVEKRKLIEDSGLVILRCHDTWDRMPEVGIVDSWAAHLGLENRIAAGDFESGYPAPVPTLAQLAEYVAAKTAELGQDSVEMLGDPDEKISKVAIGCGAGTNYEKMVELGADVIIGSDDGMHYWMNGSWALDSDLPLVLVNHCTSEEPGMKNLAEYIRKQFGVETVHLFQGSMYRVMG